MKKVIFKNICIIITLLFVVSLSFAQDNPAENNVLKAPSISSSIENSKKIIENENETLNEVYNKIDAQFKASDTLQKRTKALRYLRNLINKYPKDYGINWRAARASWFVGDWLDDAVSDKLINLGLEGGKYADAALKINPDGIEAHYYKALTASTYGRGISIIKALLKGIGTIYEQNIQWVLNKNENFDHGGALRAMGRYYWKLPWPKHDYQKSLKYLDKALKADKNVLRTYFYRADTLWSLKKYNEAKKSFEHALKTKPSEYDKKDLLWIKKLATPRYNKLIKEEF